MKASMKLREEQKPLFRAKVPLKILGFPFQSGIVAGEPKELSLNLSTFFESGPSLKVAYRPNDSLNPFSLVFKTGTGRLGSPITSSLSMKAELNLSGGGTKPSFLVHYKPHVGDFIVKKVQSLVFKKQITGDAPPPMVVDLCNKVSNLSWDSTAAGLVEGVSSDVEITATTGVTLSKNARLSFRWGVRLPATEDSSMVLMKMNNSMPGISFRKLPCLFIKKIRIDGKVRPAPIDAAEALLGVKKQLEIIQAENGALKDDMDNLEGEFSKALDITQNENKKLKRKVDFVKHEFTRFRSRRLANIR